MALRLQILFQTTETHNLTGKNSPEYPKVVTGSKHRGNRPELHLLQMWWEIIQALVCVLVGLEIWVNLTPLLC